MPIRYSELAPANAHSVIESHFGNLGGKDKMLSSLLGGGLTNLNATEGYRVYSVGVESIEQGRLLSDAKEGSWRYLIRNATLPIAEADLSIKEEGNLRVVGVHRGPSAGGTIRGIEAADAMPQVQAKDFELRIMIAPAVYFVALWLHNITDDILIPIDPDRSSLTKYQSYSEADVLSVLKPRAEKLRLAQQAKPGPSGA